MAEPGQKLAPSPRGPTLASAAASRLAGIGALQRLAREVFDVAGGHVLPAMLTGEIGPAIRALPHGVASVSMAALGGNSPVAAPAPITAEARAHFGPCT